MRWPCFGAFADSTCKLEVCWLLVNVVFLMCISAVYLEVYTCIVENVVEPSHSGQIRRASYLETI